LVNLISISSENLRRSYVGGRIAILLAAGVALTRLA
jgi:hypothetical protein